MQHVIKKYQTYIDNIRWHIKTNDPKGEELEKCAAQIDCYNEVLADLKAIVTEPAATTPSQITPPTEKVNSAGVWVFASDRLPSHSNLMPVRYKGVYYSGRYIKDEGHAIKNAFVIAMLGTECGYEFEHIEWLDEQHSTPSPGKAYLCPKCLGEGKLPNNGTSVFKTCDVCNGAKVLYEAVAPSLPGLVSDEEIDLNNIIKGYKIGRTSALIDLEKDYNTPEETSHYETIVGIFDGFIQVLEKIAAYKSHPSTTVSEAAKEYAENEAFLSNDVIGAFKAGANWYASQFRKAPIPAEGFVYAEVEWEEGAKNILTPCKEDDKEVAGAFTSMDGRSLCYVKNGWLKRIPLKDLLHSTDGWVRVEGVEDILMQLKELKPYHIMPYNLGDMGKVAALLDKLFLIALPPAQLTTDGK